MGQYYFPTIVTDKGNPVATIYSHDHGYGLKLMETSYYNAYVYSVVDYIKQHPKCRVVWAGDYADNSVRIYDKENKQWIDTTLYDKASEYLDRGRIPQIPFTKKAKDGFYILNHTKREAILYKDTTKNYDTDEWAINPLPILCADGNGRGGGDYRGTNMKYVGRWKRNKLSVSDTIPKGYKELKIKFVENY